MDEQGQIPYRDQAAVIEALRQQAALRGRTVAKELRLAVRIHLRNHLLAQLADPVGREEAQRQGYDVDADERAFREELRALHAEAYAPPRRDSLRDTLRAANGPEMPAEATG